MGYTNEILGLIASIIGFIGFVPYFYKTWIGSVRPHIFSWYLWAIFNAIAGIAQLYDGGGAGSWVNLSGSAVTLAIAILATFKGGKKDIAQSDWYALFGAILSICIWVITNNPLWSIILLTIIDIIAFYPTFRKGWFKPYEDMATIFSLSAVKHIIGIMALQNYTIITTLFPVSLVVTNLTFIIMLFIRRKILR